ncbi:aminomethyltransferase family protein [Acetobacterium sp. KB-1]|jgi:glycine cleavage system aminomethyltransferase T|uniref:aminomethyltransferase family protein n=1 Tax=Acetobacterium sp. KB-1 TaxID=2184575 RepID=UPI000DBEB3B3|nr:aminomethyltransferase family protein [Acetobacterium sp. KB-1]AWW25887.1 aminomethyl transferase family protein [Acetobacterium sp. KB-1]
MFSIDHSVNNGALHFMHFGNSKFLPSVVTSPKEELLAARSSAWLGAFLNISPVYDVYGPDADKLMNYVCVNRDFSKLKVSSSRHALLCNEKGQLLADGLVTRIDEQTLRTYWLAPAVSYYVDTLGMDVKGKWVYDEYFYQIDGPKSLEIMEKATGSDLHEMKFAGKMDVKIAGTDMSIVRLGMSGCLAYEMHGALENADKAFAAILAAGEEFGIKRLGFAQYCRNHTQGGYPNQWIQFWYPSLTSGEKMADYMKSDKLRDDMKNCSYANYLRTNYPFEGSASDNVENAFVTPFDLDWDYLINWDHDFIGKETLLKIKDNPPRKITTLEWNAEDVAAVVASSFMGQDVEPAADITSTGDGGERPFVMSKVMLDGKVIGVATGRTQDFYHRRMISLAYLERDKVVEGKDVVVIWGDADGRQMEIRAKIAAFPYYNEEYRNETFDVEKIPHPTVK